MAVILVVDDLPQIRRLLRALLVSRGHVVHEAGDGAAGLHLLEAERPALVLLDLMMPGLSGIEVLQQIRADPRFATLPIIVLTADGKAESQDRALAAGATGFVVKPFSPLALRALIDQVLAGAST